MSCKLPGDPQSTTAETGGSIYRRFTGSRPFTARPEAPTGLWRYCRMASVRPDGYDLFLARGPVAVQTRELIVSPAAFSSVYLPEAYTLKLPRALIPVMIFIFCVTPCFQLFSGDTNFL